MKKTISVVLIALITSAMLGGCGVLSMLKNSKDVEVQSDIQADKEVTLGDIASTLESKEDFEAKENVETKEDLEVKEDFEAKEDLEVNDDVEMNEDAKEEDSDEEEDPQVTALKERLFEMKNRLNEKSVDLTPRIGEFLSMDEEGLNSVEDPKGELYGFEEDLTGGCSVWCEVNDYQVEAEASSELESQGGHTYSADNIISGNKSEAWVEGVDGNGYGESITITKSYNMLNGQLVPDDECIFFYELCVVNGLARNEDVWKSNGRVKTLKFFFNGEYQGDIELEDTMKPQYISLSGLNLSAKNQESSTFRFEIADVYPGDKYEDVAITGIEIGFDSPNH